MAKITAAPYWAGVVNHTMIIKIVKITDTIICLANAVYAINNADEGQIKNYMFIWKYSKIHDWEDLHVVMFITKLKYCLLYTTYMELVLYSLQVQCSHRLPHDAASIRLLVFGIEEGPPRIQ